MRRDVPDCPLCGGTERAVVHPATRSGRIVRCAACGLVFADPRAIPPASSGGLLADKIAEGAWTRANVADRLRLVAAKTGLRGGRMLDVGCYAGFGVAAARGLGWDAVGLEPDPHAAAWGRAHLGVPIVEATAETAAFDDPFDLVAFFHSWEHLDDPVGALRRATTWLRPGGIVLLETPDFDNPWRTILGPRWRQFIADHFTFADRRTARTLLDRVGLETVHVGGCGKRMSAGLFLDRIERYYAPRAGAALARAARRTGADRLSLRLRLGDVLVALGRRRDYTS
jgi:SAM-dependent methyltransferase